MWDLPGPGLEPMCPVLAGGFLTTAPPGKPHICPILTGDHDGASDSYGSMSSWTLYPTVLEISGYSHSRGTVTQAYGRQSLRRRTGVVFTMDTCHVL